MVTSTVTPSFNTVDLNSEVTWTDLYSSLRSFARNLVYSFHVSCWRGQEEDIIEDITQETARRLIERARKAERGEADPIYSLKHMMIAIAQNYCRDLRRVDRRFSHVSPQDTTPGTFINVDEQTRTLDAVAENVFEELIIMTVAHEIASFPNKQRKALLIDLANRMSFDTRPTPLQTAFLQEGIQLKHYQQPLPSDPRERSKHASILSYAYQRIAHLPCVREYIAVA